MLAENYILDALQAERDGKQFPVSLNAVWLTFGYSERKNLIRKLLRSRLREGADFRSLTLEGTRRKGELSDFLLTVDAYKSLLLAANTDEGETARRYFIEVEKRYRIQLERTFRSPETSLSLSFDTKSKEPAFPYSSTQIHEWVDYCNRTYTRSVIKNDYEEGIDYIWVEREMYLSADAATILLNAACPRPGVIIPSELKKRPFPWDKLQQFQDNKINRRRCCKAAAPRSQSPSEVTGQLSLFD
jgi:phage anti-repressor protein